MLAFIPFFAEQCTESNARNNAEQDPGKGQVAAGDGNIGKRRFIFIYIVQFIDITVAVPVDAAERYIAVEKIIQFADHTVTVPVDSAALSGNRSGQLGSLFFLDRFLFLNGLFFRSDSIFGSGSDNGLFLFRFGCFSRFNGIFRIRLVFGLRIFRFGRNRFRLFLRNNGVHHIISGVSSSIVSHSIFAYGVDDLLAVSQLVQAGKVPFPVFGSGNGLAVDLGAVCHQVNGNGCRTLAVPVIVIDPGLAAGNVDSLRSVAVGNDETAVFRTAYNAGIAFRRSNFFNGVDDLLAAAEFIDLSEGALPSVGIIESQQRLSGISPVSKETDLDACGTPAVAVVVVLPALFNGNTGLAGCLLVCNVVSAVACAVLVNAFLEQ